jgi:hypothetical protein
VWTTIYDSGGYDFAEDVVVDSVGNTYVGGGSSGFGGGSDYLVIKLDPAGNFEWDASYNGPGDSNDNVQAIAVDVDGNVTVTGRSSRSSGCCNYDMTTVSFAPDSSTRWVHVVNGTADFADAGRDLITDASNNVYVTGYTSTQTFYDATTVKIDSSGNELWRDVVNGPSDGFDVGIAIAAGPSGTTLVAGYTDEPAGQPNFLLLAYDGAGNVVWSDSYDGPAAGSDIASDVTNAGGGRVVVTGGSDGPDGLEDVITVMFDTGLGDFSDGFESGDTQAWHGSFP